MEKELGQVAWSSELIFREGRLVEIVVEPVALSALANFEGLPGNAIAAVLALIVSGVVVAVPAIDGERFAGFRGED